VIPAVLPVAGLGTRFLPVTKVVPKELLPVVDRPCVAYAVTEALDAGLDELIFVTAPGKEALLAYFQRAPLLEARLEAAGRPEALKQVRRLTELATFIEVRQDAPRGLGHAVQIAADRIGNQAFAVLLPDNILDCRTPAIRQLLDVHQERGGAVVGLEQVPEESTHRYGVCHGPWLYGHMTVAGVVEKPAPGTSPGRHVFVGRYVLPPRIGRMLAQGKPDQRGERQLSTALNVLAIQNALTGVLIEGCRLDTGTPLGLLEATLHLALKRPELASQVRAMLARHLDTG
jgi:UTP--glucose-1-phosphate uridylyltransferase